MQHKTVETFFSPYAEAMDRYHFSPDRIYNIDETSLTTVVKPVKVICEKGKPVASQISGERGQTMTFFGIINAAGHSIPPVFIIPRRRWNDAFMRETVDGSKGILYLTGRMNWIGFVQTLEHVKEKSFSSPDNKILLIMDNAECYMNINVIDYVIQNGIVIITLTPHTTEKLQPLDISVYAPYRHLRTHASNFKLVHPHVHLTEQMLPEMTSTA